MRKTSIISVLMKTSFGAKTMNTIEDSKKKPLTENTASKKISSYVESVMSEMERNSSEFDNKRKEIEQEINRGARITKRGLH
jgi:hypothetical protein